MRLLAISSATLLLLSCCVFGGGYLDPISEHELFRTSGICAAENVTQLRACGETDVNPVRELHGLQHLHCYCDARCGEYGDCCINAGPPDGGSKWSCREVRAENVPSIPIYVYQKCPDSWTDGTVRDLCQIEAQALEKAGKTFSHLQDLPVLGETSQMWYRNVYCAMCNRDTRLVEWSTYPYCNGDHNRSENTLEKDMDFSSAVYHPRTMNFRKVKVDGKLKNCQLIVRNFNLKKIFWYGARLCKPAIATCPDGTDPELRFKCSAYASYVYKVHYTVARREVYNNFHCAMCNGVAVEVLSCTDPLSGVIFSEGFGDIGRSTLSLLFDFNFDGGMDDVGGIAPCRLSDGQIWDPIFKVCKNFTCGKLFQRVGSKCVPLNDTGDVSGIESDCVKVPLSPDSFQMFPNGSIYVNASDKVLSPKEYETHSGDDGETQIVVCLEDDYNLLPFHKLHSWLSIVTLTVSIICLILHLSVYSLLKSLRNCPGKILMSLSASLLCGHIFLLLGPNFVAVPWLCYVTSAVTHFGYVSAFAWMSVMAYDIHGTFSAMQNHRSSKKSILFLKYSSYAWLTSVCVVALSVIMDYSLHPENKFRPKYGEPICWFNHRKGLLIFFVVPAAVLLFSNLVLFVITAVHIRKVSQQTKMVNNFSDKVRYFLYLKLSIVLGLTWILGFLAGITRMDVFWYPFIILNGLQGALIFVSFTMKRNILKQLAVKLRIRSDKYSIGKRRGIRAAMYSSLSNLTTMQTSVSSQIPSSTTSTEMLKAVRRINPDEIAPNTKKL